MLNIVQPLICQTIAAITYKIDIAPATKALMWFIINFLIDFILNFLLAIVWRTQPPKFYLKAKNKLQIHYNINLHKTQHKFAKTKMQERSRV